MAEADGERVWLERELEELRARETEYRKRVGHDAALGARLHGYAQSMHQMFRRRPPTREELDGTLLRVARLSAQALSIRRTSVWRFDGAGKRLACVLQLVDDEVISPSDLVIEASRCPTYVDALRHDFAVAVDDVRKDPRTQELMAYIKEHDIGALLDIPIVIPGKLLGVVCHEHLGRERRWNPREIEFASSVGQLIALALEAERRVEAERAAKGTEAKYQHLVESLPVTVYSFDPHTGKLDYVSPRVAELGGLTAEEWLEQGAGEWIRQIHPDDRAPVLDRFRVGAGRGFPEELTYRVMLPNDEVRWVRDTCSVVRDYAGEPLVFQGVLVDVTAQTEAELARREFERRYRSLLENVDLMAVSLDTEGKVTFVNEAFLRVSGYSLDELIGRDWFETMLPTEEREPVRKRYLDNLAKERVAPRFELTIVTKSGERRRILATNTMLRAPEGTPVGASSLALDVTDRRKLEHELLLQTKLESLGRLAAGVAHDFNNLITVMVGQVELLKRSSASKPEADISHQLSTMDQVLGQATELTRSLLTYGRHEESGPLEDASLDELVRASMPLLDAMTGEGVRITTSLHAADAVFKFDRSRMRQVLVNLVGNAADATSGHGHRVQVRTHVEFLDENDARAKGAKEGGEFAVLTVADDGRGMDPATLAQVFEPFFTTKAEGRGTGLGLAITQSIVSHMGGFTAVESELGVGSTFRVYLPVKPLRLSAVYPAAYGGGAAKPAPRVLVVDGRPEARDAIGRPLNASGYEVIDVPSTRIAAEILASDDIDLLITASRLPDGTGAVLARSARSVRPSLRVVVVSETPEASAAFDDVLLEPLDETELLRSVRAALEGPPEAG
jgi:two-component system, cell cycle sensor histidine kinase and response regulator CckA